MVSGVSARRRRCDGDRALLKTSIATPIAPIVNTMSDGREERHADVGVPS